MQVIIASVTLTVPDNMTPEQIIRDLETSIAFGRPKISIMYGPKIRERPAGRCVCTFSGGLVAVGDNGLCTYCGLLYG